MNYFHLLGTHSWHVAEPVHSLLDAFAQLFVSHDLDIPAYQFRGQAQHFARGDRWRAKV